MSLASAIKGYSVQRRSDLAKVQKGKYGQAVAEGIGEIVSDVVDVAGKVGEGVTGNIEAWEDYEAGQEHLGLDIEKPVKGFKRWATRPKESRQIGVSASEGRDYSAKDLMAMGSLLSDPSGLALIETSGKSLSDIYGTRMLAPDDYLTEHGTTGEVIGERRSTDLGSRQKVIDGVTYNVNAKGTPISSVVPVESEAKTPWEKYQKRIRQGGYQAYKTEDEHKEALTKFQEKHGPGGAHSDPSQDMTRAEWEESRKGEFYKEIKEKRGGVPLVESNIIDEMKLSDKNQFPTDMAYGTPKGLEMLKQHEGIKDYVYTDSTGTPTWGIGHKLTTEELKEFGLKPNMEANQDFDKKYKVSEEKYMQSFKADYGTATKDAKALFKNFEKIDPKKQDALINMALNLGRTKLKSEFKNFIDAVNSGNWAAAKREMMFESMAEDAKPSLWSTQVKGRATDLSEIIGYTGE